MHEAIVVGARCGGAPLAMLLARQGHKVALVDRVPRGRDTLSTHFLWPRGAARLATWGLLDRLRARGCDPISEITFDVGPVQLVGHPPPVGDAADSYCPRRTVLDPLLVDAAVEAGAEFIEGFVVSGLRWSDGCVTGVSGHRRGSSLETTIGASVVVGADGLHSTIAHRVGASPYNAREPLTCVYYSYWSGFPERRASFHARPGLLVLVWPTNDDLTCISVAWPAHDYATVKADVPRAFRLAVEAIGGLADKIAAAARVERFSGTQDLPNLYRTSFGPGWALVGDAGHHKDPSTGMGISDAFLGAELLAEAIHTGLMTSGGMLDALSAYQHERDALTDNGFQLTLRTARLAPLSPRLHALYREAVGKPDEIRRIFGVLGGTVPMHDLRAPAGTVG